MDDYPRDSESDATQPQPWTAQEPTPEADPDDEATEPAAPSSPVTAPREETVVETASPEPHEAAALNPPERPLPDSRALIPPVPSDPLLPPSPLYRPDDVFRGGAEEGADFREGLVARPPRSRFTTPAPAAPPAPVVHRPSKWSTIALPLLAGAIGAGLVVGGFFLLRDDEPAPIAAPGTETVREVIRTEFVGPDDASADPVAVARKVIPSVVTVDVGVSNGAGGFNGTGSGSGVVLSADGYIVTNEHVVNGSDVVTVTFSDGRLYEAELLGADPTTDLAVLKISAAGLIPIDIGSSEGLSIGDLAIAAGSPLGLEGGPTVTVGVISAFDREVQTGPDDRLLGMLQTDAPITRGSSGGALVDGLGALIGVTSAVGVSDVGVEGIGFAIPIEVVQRITDEIIANGEVQHSFLGIEGRTSLEDQSDGAEVAVGVFVQDVIEDSGAANGDIREGDIIFSLEGHDVKTIDSLVGRLRRYKVGQPLEVGIVRAGETIALTIELGPRPDVS
ncbi:MAG: trypsin-like peptidase domain-containing protein [Acidimicrobiia bacterium]